MGKFSNGWGRGKFFLVGRRHKGREEQRVLTWDELNEDWYTAGFSVVNWCYAVNRSDARRQMIIE